MSRLISAFLLLVVVILGVVFFDAKQTQLFLPHHISLSVPFHPEWETAPPEVPLEPIFSQPFTYLGEGHQCVAFESQDRQYVLKFPHASYNSPSLWQRFLSFLAQKQQDQQAHWSHKKLIKDAARYLLAFERLKDETGLVYLHLNRTASLKQKVTLKDKTGLQHLIDLDLVEFIVQKKAELLYPAIEKWMGQGQLEEAKQGLSHLIELFSIRSAKGIEDPEQYLDGNFGFLGTRAIQIDLGHWSLRQGPCDKALEKAKVWRLLSPFKKQLDSTYPELSHHLEKEWTASFIP